MFNRWLFLSDRESLLTRAFVTVNVAGSGARLI